MVIIDGVRWNRVRSRNITGHLYNSKFLSPVDFQIPDVFITIDGRVPKNMGGSEVFDLWPSKHHGAYRFIGSYGGERMDNSYGYYYTIKSYTFWDGVLYTHSSHYGKNNQEIEYVENQMRLLCENHEEQNDSYPGRPFASRPGYHNARLVNARYVWKGD